jgi:adenylosuccinate lyase
VQAGASRDEAYRIVQELSQQAAQQGMPLRELLAADARVREAALDLDAIFDHEHYTRYAEEIVARLEAIVALPARSS